MLISWQSKEERTKGEEEKEGERVRQKRNELKASSRGDMEHQGNRVTGIR